MGGHYKKVINTQPQATTPYQPTNPSGQGFDSVEVQPLNRVILYDIIYII